MLVGDRGQGEGDKDCLGTPSELQFESPGVNNSALSAELFCFVIDWSTGISAKPKL